MTDRDERTGLTGVSFLFAFIALFLLVICLKQTAHARLAAVWGLTGSALLSAAAGRFLLHKWRAAPDPAAFDEDGDVPFCGAVFLLTSIALAGGLMRVAGIDLSRAVPILLLLLCAATTPARKFAKSLRHPR
jgi:hypothetical protein